MTTVQGTRGAATLVIAPARGRYSQTFVRDHIARLPKPLVTLYGRSYKLEDEAGTPLLTDGWERLARLAGAVGRAGAVRKRARSDAVARFCRQHDVGVALAEFGPTAAASSGDLARAGVPLVAQFHGYDAYERDTLAEWLPRYQNMFERQTDVVAVSEHMRRQLLELGAAAERTHVIRMGVDVERFRGARPADAPPHFLVVGRFVEKKAPERAVEAFAQALAREPSARLIMVGDGPQLDATRQRVGALGLQDAVEFRPPVSSEAVAELMRSARGLVAASVTAGGGDREGTPVVVLEAMASGLPVIGTRHTGIGEVVEDGRTGLLSDEDDTAGVGANISRLATDPELAGQLGANGAMVARERHSLTASIAALSAVLESARERGAQR
jgi:glycosyltransferase involved in cell wall biosynthesis